jgi:hypothetical protein
LKSAFRKISRVRSILGGTTWYLSEDCLLAAKGTRYSVEYRRFYLRDLEWIVVWPNRSWLLRLIPGALVAIAGACFWHWLDSSFGAIVVGVGVAWALLELALGPTAGSRVRTTGVSVDLPLVKRTRRAGNVLQAIDVAVRAARDVTVQPVVSISSVPTSSISTSSLPIPSLQQAESPVQTSSEVGSEAPSMSDASLTNGS